MKGSCRFRSLKLLSWCFQEEEEMVAKNWLLPGYRGLPSRRSWWPQEPVLAMGKAQSPWPGTEEQREEEEEEEEKEEEEEEKEEEKEEEGSAAEALLSCIPRGFLKRMKC
ncbi:hypothetical protein llap_18864 [Limosa lapponica baueri]|uniref:Uncharacterized protein n=1 Tax=Limosa lapponica baueri TaxID=1758121 RepID=A0A2I0TAP6_LIMLA|nr:hypothetical protein llap_18864 [Limosa lapponica baueri]